MAHFGSDDDDETGQRSDSSDEEHPTPMQASEAAAMAAHLETMKKQRANTGPSNIKISGPSQYGGSEFVMVGSPNTASNGNTPNTYQHGRHNSNGLNLQPRLSNGSLHSASAGHYPPPMTTAQSMQMYPQPTTPNSYTMQQAHAAAMAAQQQQPQRTFFGGSQNGSRQSDPGLSMPSLNERMNDDINPNSQITLSQIWNEIKEIKTKLTEEQSKNEELRNENKKLRDKVRQKNRKIKSLTSNDNNNNTNINSNSTISNNDDNKAYIVDSDEDDDDVNNGNLVNNRNNKRRDTESTIGTDESVTDHRNNRNGKNNKNENITVFGDWMASIGCSMQAKKCNWF